MKLTPAASMRTTRFARLRSRIRDVLVAEDLETARGMDADRFHDGIAAAAVSGGASGNELIFFLIGFSVFR